MLSITVPFAVRRSDFRSAVRRRGFHASSADGRNASRIVIVCCVIISVVFVIVITVSINIIIIVAIVTVATVIIVIDIILVIVRYWNITLIISVITVFALVFYSVPLCQWLSLQLLWPMSCVKLSKTLMMEVVGLIIYLISKILPLQLFVYFSHYSDLISF